MRFALPAEGEPGEPAGDAQVIDHLIGRGGVAQLVLISTLLLLLAGTFPSEAETADSCVDCHSDPNLLVRSPKLWEYFQEWESSIHRQEGLSCSNCHGGNPEAADEEAAHGGPLGGAAPESAVSFRNIPDTCGECHADIREAYAQSAHARALDVERKQRQGPNCVTCHESVDESTLDVLTVKEACAQCHNDETNNHREIPERARRILARFRSIHQLYRYIGVRAEPLEAGQFFRMIDPELRDVTMTWHTVDLPEIERKTKIVLNLLKQKRDEIRRRRASEAPTSEPEDLGGY